MANDKKKNILLKDIAKETGFSINTVSHALSGKPDISDATKALIKEAADRLGYIGNASASFLRSGVSKLISIILGDISNPHFSIMVKEIEMYLKKLGYVSFVINTNENEETEREAILASLNKNVDGIIICPSPDGAENIRYLKSFSTPFVLIGRRLKEMETDYVVCDDVNGGYAAAKHLLERGHTDILFLNGPLTVSSAEERLSGYKRALEEAHIPFSKQMVCELPMIMGKTNTKIDRILSRPKEYTAIITFSDMIAWEVIYTLKTKNIRVPEDVSIVGFDNIQSKFFFPVLLTTVSSSKATMAKKAVEILMKRIQKAESKPVKIVLETSLVVRESTRDIGIDNGDA